MTEFFYTVTYKQTEFVGKGDIWMKDGLKNAETAQDVLKELKRKNTKSHIDIIAFSCTPNKP